MEMKDAGQIVDMLLETEQVRVCPYCDQEHGIQVAPGQAKSHGLCCRRHMDTAIKHMAGDNPALQAQMRQLFARKTDADFSPEYRPPAAQPVQ